MITHILDQGDRTRWTPCPLHDARDRLPSDPEYDAEFPGWHVVSYAGHTFLYSLDEDYERR